MTITIPAKQKQRRVAGQGTVFMTDESGNPIMETPQDTAKRIAARLHREGAVDFKFAVRPVPNSQDIKIYRLS